MHRFVFMLGLFFGPDSEVVLLVQEMCLFDRLTDSIREIGCGPKVGVDHDGRESPSPNAGGKAVADSFGLQESADGSQGPGPPL